MAPCYLACDAHIWGAINFGNNSGECSSKGAHLSFVLLGPPLKIEFSIWLASKTRWTHLTKVIEMESVPRIGEFMKFNNKEVGDYFAWEVTQITYRESGAIEVWTELLDDIDSLGYFFEEEEEFDECFESYLTEGWHSERGISENRRVLNKHNQKKHETT